MPRGKCGLLDKKDTNLFDHYDVDFLPDKFDIVSMIHVQLYFIYLMSVIYTVY